MADNTLPLFGGSCKYYVYVYRDPRPRKKNAPIYVGKGTAEHGRADVHWARGARNEFLESILTKIRRDGLRPSIEIVAWYEDEQSSLECERQLIAMFGRRDQGNGPLCNLTDGGDGYSHSEITIEKIRAKRAKQIISHSDETKRKIGAANKIALTGRKNPEHGIKMKGRNHSPEHCAAISSGNMGRVVSTETIEKIRVSNTGKKRSEETRLRLSISHLGKNQSPQTKNKRGASLKIAWELRRSADFVTNREMGLKKCCKCKEPKSYLFYSKCASRPDGLLPACKSCEADRKKTANKIC